MAAAAGYSGTPLAKKLGLRDGQAVAFAGLPATLESLLAERAFAFVERVDDWRDISGLGWITCIFLPTARPPSRLRPRSCGTGSTRRG